MAVPQYTGTQAFAQALMGGPSYEQAQYDERTAKLIRQRSQQALMEKRMDEARVSKIQANQFEGLPGVITDPRVLALTQSPKGTGANYLSAEKGSEQNMQNQVMQLIMGLLESAGGEGGGGLESLDPDLINILTGISQGKMTTDSNLDVVPRAQARTRATDELANYRDALTGKAQADTGTSNARPGLVGAQQQYYEERDRGGSSAASAKAPFSNATYATAFLGGGDEENPTMDDQGFLAWQWKQAQIDPRYDNDRYAWGAFTQPGGPIEATPPGDQSEHMNAITGVEDPKAKDPVEEKRTPQGYTEADAQVYLDAYQRYASQMAGNPEAIAEARKRTAQRLSEMGFEMTEGK